MHLPHVCAAARLVLAIGPRASRALALPDDELRAALALAARYPTIADHPSAAGLVAQAGGAAFLRSLTPPRVRPAPPPPPPVRLAALSEAPDGHTDGLGGGAWSYSHAKRHGAHTVRKQCDEDDARAQRQRVLSARERPFGQGRVCMADRAYVARRAELPPPVSIDPPDPEILREVERAITARAWEARRAAAARHVSAFVAADPTTMPEGKKPEMRTRSAKR